LLGAPSCDARRRPSTIPNRESAWEIIKIISKPAKNQSIKDPALYIAVLFIAAPRGSLLVFSQPWRHTSSRWALIGRGFECRAQYGPRPFSANACAARTRCGHRNCQVDARRIALWVAVMASRFFLLCSTSCSYGLQVTAQIFTNCSRGALTSKVRDQAGHDSLTMARDGFRVRHARSISHFEQVGEGLFGAHRLLTPKSCRYSQCG